MRIGLAAPEETLNLDMLEDDVPEEKRHPKGTYYIKAQHPGIAEDEVHNAAFDFGADQKKEGEITLTGDVRAVGGYLKKCVVQIIDFCLPVTAKSGKDRRQKWDPANDGDNDDNKELYLRLLDPALIVGPDGDTLGEMLISFLDAVAGRGTDAAEKHEERKKKPS